MRSFRLLFLFIKPIIWLTFIVVLCFLPAEDLPQTSLVNILYFDKIIHFGMYFILAVLLARPLKTVRLQVWLFILLISVFIGGAIEILQFAITSSRSASWGDFFADFVGTITGLLSFGFFVSGKKWEKFV